MLTALCCHASKLHPPLPILLLLFLTQCDYNAFLALLWDNLVLHSITRLGAARSAATHKRKCSLPSRTRGPTCILVPGYDFADRLPKEARSDAICFWDSDLEHKTLPCLGPGALANLTWSNHCAVLERHISQPPRALALLHASGDYSDNMADLTRTHLFSSQPILIQGPLDSLPMLSPLSKISLYPRF